MSATTVSEAVAVNASKDAWVGHFHEGWDIFGVTHGGYMMAVVANAVLHETALPDLFTVTAHFLRKGVVGPVEVTVTEVGASRRFRSVNAVAVQNGEPMMNMAALLGNRDELEGPSWSAVEPWDPETAAMLSGPSESETTATFPLPSIHKLCNMKMDAATAGFIAGTTDPNAEMRATMDADVTDQLAALIACDLTPPAIWNSMGPSGWVPTMELTAHIRNRPVDGPLRIDTRTHHMTDGFLEEDALVHDAEGRLIVQSRQLARWTGV